MAKRLYRSSSNKVIGGVCGGFAEFLGVDATWVRLVAAILAVIGGTGVVLYVALWLFLPEDSTGDIGLDGVFDFYQSHRDRPSARP
ncbi:MAG: PspC domain-containing protein [Propionibacteriaceae bacterium]|nr:PspC domain-containing protein [Propionibacteriaceae bacterium]